VGQAAGDFELRGCCSVGYRGVHHRVVDRERLALAICSSCIAVSLRRHVQCLVWWNQAGPACACALCSGLQLLLFAADLFVRSDQGIAAPGLFCALRPFCRVADRRTKERSRIAERRARRPIPNS
jgi:hypothetical protein